MQYPFTPQIPGCVSLLVEPILRPANERLAEQQLIWGRLGGDEGDELLVEPILRPANERLAEQQLIWLGGDEGDELLVEPILRQPMNG